jgi:hypothetical protein
MGIHNVYCNDNVAFRQYVGNTLTAIKQEIANLDGVDEANIKSGVTILGFEGTYTNEDVADAATALDIAEGKVAYVNGKRIVGVAGIEKYTLTVDKAGTGTSTGSVTVDGDAYVAPIDFKAGSEIELVATPDAGSIFVNWTVGGAEVSTETTFSYTMPKAATTIVANFDSEGL